MTGTTQRKSDLGTRAAAGLVMIAVALAALWAGGIAFWLLASAAAMLMIGEWAGLVRSPRWQVTLAIVLVASVMVAGRWLISDPLRTDLYPGRVLVMMFGLAAIGAVALAAGSRR